MNCPICKRDTFWEENPFRPFCSERCRMMDLGKWAAEEYRLPEQGPSVSDDSAEKASKER
ncbi:MAG TPA: DNA gyrase inhibitor YacG [Terriglobia bacterium]|nr:DNA gyrase inhibitor YacG [Terriglobia bacterium]